ncbi:RNA polymerase sigma factor CnrH [Thalassoglobus neptunius]|uniref:RNA polymerase sigma factor CnrH n=1 Tax=Thalassoglobus neptunius TaxID=1938619 RepID=A0A5C5VNH1_9PLAN|nr:sigma-70 family RNA polymerase sigma factor [Thalassoglobus neptunius]TWT40128.1 RNA polymerase sigma factor CnrH [Thalassoglobus neptunius]
MSENSIWPQHEITQNLVREVANGNETAVNDLLERHRQALRRLVHFRLDRQIANRVDASDVVQDVLLEASRRLKDYVSDPKMPFHLWIRQLAQDRMIDLHRRHHAQKRSVDKEQRLQSPAFGDRSSLDLAAQLRDDQLTPAAAMIRKELEERFLQALEQLDENEREIIVMRHVEHLGNGEIAEALNLSPAAAGMRYLRAIRRLKAVLTDSSSESEASSD